MQVVSISGRIGRADGLPEKPREYCFLFDKKYPCDGVGDGRAKHAGYCLCWEDMENYEIDIAEAKSRVKFFEDQDQEIVKEAIYEHLNPTTWPMDIPIKIQDLVLYSLDIDNLVEEVEQIRLKEPLGHKWEDGIWHTGTTPPDKYEYRTIIRFK